MSGVDLVYLARHGRTALNVDGRLRGLSNPPLDTVGGAEAQRLADTLAAYAPTVVISSPLQRAVSTAEAIGVAAHIAVVVDTRLNDRDTGRGRAGPAPTWNTDSAVSIRPPGWSRLQRWRRERGPRGAN